MTSITSLEENTVRNTYDKQRIIFKVIISIIGLLALFGLYLGLNAAIIKNLENQDTFISNFYQQNKNNYNTTCLCRIKSILNNGACPPFTAEIYCDNIDKNITAITCDSINYIKNTNVTCRTSDFYDIQFAIPNPPVYFPTVNYVFAVIMFPIIFLMIFVTVGFVVMSKHPVTNN